MVGKSEIKLIRSLHLKKYRSQQQLFIAEGRKVITELLHSHFKLRRLYLTEGETFGVDPEDLEWVDEQQLKKMSALTTPNRSLAVFEMKKPLQPELSDLIVALDDIRDPGNLGTIIRLCDWFGIKDLVCSEKTVDCYNPKVVQASMGSLSRVNIVYLDLPVFLKSTKSAIMVADMDGNDIYEYSLPQHGVLVMGNEANGISEAVKTLATATVSIPRFGDLQQTESLNVATATGIMLSEYRREHRK